MRARNHRLGRGRCGALPALAGKTGQHEVNDDDCDDEKEELAHAAMAGGLAPRLATRRHYTGAGREDGRVGRLVGVTGFEPATPASRTQYSTRLSYTPNRTGANAQEGALRELSSNHARPRRPTILARIRGNLNQADLRWLRSPHAPLPWPCSSHSRAHRSGESRP